MAKRKKAAKEKVTEEQIASGERVSGEPDANLAAAGGGGIAGALVGGALGATVGGPIGGVVGAAAGAIAAGAAAEKIEDEIDPKLEEIYWRDNYANQSYYKESVPYENYLPAYRFGWEHAVQKEYWDRDFLHAESKLKHDWEKDHSDLGPWDSVRAAVRDAYERIRERRLAGSATRG